MASIFFVYDSEDEIAVSEKLKGLSPKMELAEESSYDRAAAKIAKNRYDIIVVGSGRGRLTMLDVADSIRGSRPSKHADVVVLERHPTETAKFIGILRGKRVFKFRLNQIDELVKLIERML